MSAFKVGDKVRIIGAWRRPEILGKTGVVSSPLKLARRPPDGVTPWMGHLIELDEGDPPDFLPFVPPEHLAPLTDPKADEFIAAIKKLKPYSEPLVKRIGEKA